MTEVVGIMRMKMKRQGQGKAADAAAKPQGECGGRRNIATHTGSPVTAAAVASAASAAEAAEDVLSSARSPVRSPLPEVRDT